MVAAVAACCCSPLLWERDHCHGFLSLGAGRQAGLKLHSLGIYGPLVNGAAVVLGLCCRVFPRAVLLQGSQWAAQAVCMVTLQLFAVQPWQEANDSGAFSHPLHIPSLWSAGECGANMPKPSGPNSLEGECCFGVLACTGQRGVSWYLGWAAWMLALVPFRQVGKEMVFAKYIWAIRYAQLTGSSLFFCSVFSL